MRILILAYPLSSLLIASLVLANLGISVDAAPIPPLPLSGLELAVFSLEANQNDSPVVTTRPKPNSRPEADQVPAERRPPVDELDQTEWLAIMMAHRFTTTEIADVFGISPDEANQLVQNTKPESPFSSPIREAAIPALAFLKERSGHNEKPKSVCLPPGRMADMS